MPVDAPIVLRVSPEPATCPPPVLHPPPPVRSAVHPLLPVVLPLVVTAIALNLLFARLFPGLPGRPAPAVRFTEVAAAAGLSFRAHAAADSPTTLAGGVAVLDYDGDRHPDLFFVNGAPWPWEAAPAGDPPRAGALFRNDGRGRFTDVTATAGFAGPFQGMAAVAGDYDADGHPDLFLTGIGGQRLYRNRGNGTFSDVTAAAGLARDDNSWSTGAAWLDVDADGRLDLVVAHYARWPQEVGLAVAFSVASVGRSYGAPAGFFPAYPSVYRNRGDGAFALLPDSAGLRDTDPATGLPVAKVLAVAPVDANRDGRLDLLFAYHTSERALFLHQADGRFRKWSGGDIRREGVAVAVATASALAHPTTDASADRLAALLAAAPEPPADADRADLAAKLGLVILDVDLDGRLEAFSGRGLAEPDTNRFDDHRDFIAAPALLWRGDTGWQAADAAFPPVAARGIAAADFDGDGDPDLAVATQGGPPLLLRNDQRHVAPWLRVSLVATRTHPEAAGARVEVHTPRRVFIQTMAPATGFLGQSESVLTFGLAEDARVRRVVVHWPSGRRQELRPIVLNQHLVIREE